MIMRNNDEDIKIFHPKKNDSSGADLASLALLMDSYRSNGNMEKAVALGERLAQTTPENLCAADAAKLTTNEVRQLRALIVFAAQIFLHKYLPHPMLSSQAVNSMYGKLSETSQGFFANISDGSSFTFYYLSVRKNKNIEENIGKNFAMLCDKDNDDYLVSLGGKVYSMTEALVCELIDEAKFVE